MGICINHPEKKTDMVCMKHKLYMCEQCTLCSDPKIHCKYRPACPVWFLDKRGGKEIDE